ncbi:MAG: DUF3540 domain-containing protein [Deltaproteobacteria bacterium]|nr:DUF3540 domain-containing protein [Deltaproteobacteria bacterium]MBW2532527.1 DUF3540 domain-containing protein [Deltaproteobacteria bacterium]
MSNLAQTLHPEEITHLAGIAERAIDGRWLVRTSTGRYRARRATSCLLEPVVGDRVTLAVDEAGESYIVSVLERQGERPRVRIAVDGDVELDVSGRYAVAARRGVDLVSGEDFNVISGKLSLKAVDGRVAFERLSYVGKVLQGKVEQLRTVSRSVEAVAERVTETAKRCYRFVSEFDQLRAERIDHQAAKTLRMHGQNTVVTAQRLVQVDGDRIHLG